MDDTDTTPCVEALSNAEDPGCNTPPFPLGYAFYDLNFGFNVVLCQSNIGAGAYLSGQLDTILNHELMHIYGLAHVNREDATNCSGIAANTARDFCPTSDGCDGEVMCSIVPCQRSPFLVDGDGDGLRQTFGGSYQSRKVFYARDTVPGLSNPAFVQTTTGKTAAFAPRIDCSKAGNPTNQCAVAVATRTSGLNQLSVIRLNGATGGTWTTESVARTLSVGVSMPVDIAINPQGTVAYITRVDDVGVARVTRVPLDGTATTTTILPGNPVLPPRIAWGSGTLESGQLFVLMMVSVAGGAETFGTPVWQLVRVPENASSAVIVDFDQQAGGFDIDDNFSTGICTSPANCGAGDDCFLQTCVPWYTVHSPMSDFDFDCIAALTEADCTIVALLRHDDADVAVRRPRSIRFRRNAVDLSQAQLLDTDWDFAANDANGILGVTLTTQRMYVALSDPLTTNADTGNTRIVEISGQRVSGTVSSTVLFRGDAETCSTGAAHGYSIAGASTHGGESIAWCATCGGTIEAASWGRRADGDAFCF